MELLKTTWKKNPLSIIIFSAIFLRLLAVLFARGWGMHDDHFLVIEAAQSWADDYDYNNWLPSSGRTQPQGHSFFYVGLHYFFFQCTNFFGLLDGQIKMLLVRLIHAALSMMVVVLGYRIAEHFGGKKAAKTTGLLLAVYWFMPWLSVRNLVEVVCIPFILWSISILIKSEKKAYLRYLLAGAIMAISFSIRFQTGLIGFGLGLVLLLQRKWWEAIIFGFGFFFIIALTQGLVDYFIWGFPFAEMGEYIRYNMANATNYIQGEWYNYILLIAGILIPPISIFILFGWLRSWKKQLILFLPAALFLIFHSYFPNKQERFILPIVPLIIIGGIAGWEEFIKVSRFWKQRKKLYRICWIFFWSINILLLPFITLMHSKKARTESVSYVANYKGLEQIFVEDANRDEALLLPLFYLNGQWPQEVTLGKIRPLDSLKPYFFVHPPDFVFFYEDKNLPERLEVFEECYPDLLQYDTTFQPGFIDLVMHKLNPHNKNRKIHLYRNIKKYPIKISNK